MLLLWEQLELEGQNKVEREKEWALKTARALGREPQRDWIKEAFEEWTLTCMTEWTKSVKNGTACCKVEESQNQISQKKKEGRKQHTVEILTRED